MYIKHILVIKSSKQIKNLISLEGVNGSGKTTLLRNIVGKYWAMFTMKKLNTHIYKSMEREQYAWNTEDNVHNSIKQEYAIEIYYFSGLKAIHKNVEHYSSGQKKKLKFVTLLLGNNYVWYMDEPKNYLDNLAYNLLVNKLKHHLNIGGKVIITSNASIIIKKTITKISLSRFELLTTRLSSECSTTEL
jgi:ABC-type transport system involved in cytochrome c biogenesis ATPase subunit